MAMPSWITDPHPTLRHLVGVSLVVSFLFIITSAALRLVSDVNKISDADGGGRLKLATNTETQQGEH